MILAQITGFILICLMIALIYLTTRFVSDVRFNGKGIYHITVNAWFRGNKMYKEWSKENKGYYYCIAVIIGLTCTILLLIEPFSEKRMIVRPEASLFVSGLLWLAMLKRDQWFFKKIRG